MESLLRLALGVVLRQPPLQALRRLPPQLQELALALLLRSMLSVVVMDGPVQPLA
tara:strand:- start:133 stop:297 length:165 start_codon:yes stop_codon:yes gene_type:complete